MVFSELVKARLKAHSGGAWTGVAGFMDRLTNAQARNLVSEAVCEQRNIGNIEEVLKGTPNRPGIIERLRQKYFERELAIVAARLANLNLADEEKLRLLHERAELSRLKQQPLQ